MKKFLNRLGIHWCKSCTHYEFQIRQVVFWWVHLGGDYWKGRPWRRFDITYHEHW